MMPTLSSSSSSASSATSSSSESSDNEGREEPQPQRREPALSSPPVAKQPKRRLSSKRKRRRMKDRLLQERIDAIRQDNDLVISRICEVKRLCKLKLAHRQFLIDRLDRHGDNYHHSPVMVPNETSKDKKEIRDKKKSVHRQQQQLHLRDQSQSPASGGSAINKSQSQRDEGGVDDQEKQAVLSKSLSKRKKRLKDLDREQFEAKIPAKPHNAYFYFCQEFRPSVMEIMNSNHESSPDKREVASVLTAKWNALSFDQKQVYYRIQDNKKREYEAALKRWEELSKQFFGSNE